MEVICEHRLGLLLFFVFSARNPLFGDFEEVASSCPETDDGITSAENVDIGYTVGSGAPPPKKKNSDSWIKKKKVYFFKFSVLSG